MIAVADQAAFLDGQRRVVDQGRLDLRADLGAELEGRLELVEPLRDPGGEPGLDLGQDAPGSWPGRPGRAASPGRCRPAPPAAPGRTTGRASVRRSPRRADWLSSSSTASSRSAISSVDGQGRRQPVGQEPRTHRRAERSITLEQRALALAFAERPHQLQAPPGHLVERQRVGAAIGDQPGDVAQRRLLRLAQVRHQRPGGLDLRLRSSMPKPASVVVRTARRASCGPARAGSPTTGEP